MLLKNKPLYSSLGELLDSEYKNTHEIFWDFPYEYNNPVFCRYSPDIEYGCVHVENTDYRVILGPSFGVPVTEQLIQTYMHENATPLEYKETVTEFLCAIPCISHQQFSRHLALVYQSLNQKDIQLDDLFAWETNATRKRTSEQLLKRIDNLENNNLHNTWGYEQELYSFIKNGDVRKLEDFLASYPKSPNEGKLANTPLRHAKNLFILNAAKIAILSAIPAGIDIEKTYHLTDLYIQECEQQLTIEGVKSLQLSMVRDFCTQAGEAHIPDGISAETYQCINYIRSHTNSPISISSVAQHVHRSNSYVLKLFKKELGINMGSFITRCKLEEAKSLLTYSEKSLAEISSYLCFSSQSYFQNVFKKKYGMTPLQYRKEHQKI
ncbi:MAG: AraC family transcriptional regulator [Clostridiales bacterium]|nr:AraC family transcriptional regulator [Clostridiales bacterium]